MPASAAAKHTVLAAVSAMLFVAICVAGPAGGAQRDRIRPNGPTNPHVTESTPTSVTIAWGASTDNVAVVGYEVYVGSKRTRVTGTSHALRKLACGTAFSVAVAAVDAAGNRSRKTSMIAASSACADSTRPSAPTGFRQAATSGDAVVLTWQPSSDDVGVVAYGVYDEFTRSSSTSEPTTTLTGLACGSTEVVSIDAVDAAGNRSARQQAYVETAACPLAQTMSVYSATASLEWTQCAREREQCSFSGTAEVRYGANGTWTSPRSFTNGVACTNSVFGDPIYGVRKSCERRSVESTPTPPTTQWTYCAQEGAACSFSGSREVRYGANGTWTSPRTFTSSVVCTNRVFGDPLYGVAKSCHTRVLSTPPTAPTPDTTPPARPIISIGAVGRNTATLNWQPGVDNVGVDHYAVWLDGSLVTRTTSTSHTYTGLECDTQYDLGLQVVDAAGNTSVLAEALWQIRTTACSSTTTIDRQPPTTPANLAIASATQTSIRLSWTASTDNVGVTGYDIERGGASATSVTSPGATVAGLTCGTSYDLGVKAFDAAGNRSSAASVVGSTSPCSDTQAPSTPTNVTASSRTATSVALSWSASTDNMGVVGYGLYRGGVLTGTTSSAPGIVSGLTCNTNYTLAVDAYDASGNRSPRATIAAATTACPDTTPPSPPTGLAASGVTQTGLVLSWNASSDNVAVTGYDVYRDGTRMASVTSTSTSQAGLACGTSYSFAVVARDAAGNSSAQSQLNASSSPCSAPASSGGDLYVSVSGSDSNPCSQAAPCKSWNRAYQLAQCGQTVSIAAGSFPSQQLTERSSCVSARVTLQGAGASTVVDSILFGTASRWPDQTDAPDDLVLKSFKTRGIKIMADATNVTLDQIDGGSFDIWGKDSATGPRNITIRNSDWGPCYVPSHPSYVAASRCNPFDDPGDQKIKIYNATNISLESNVVHEYLRLESSPEHFECIALSNVDTFAARGNRFFGCYTNALAFLSFGGPVRGTWYIENNWFGESQANNAVKWAGGPPCGDVYIRFNSFAPGEISLDEESGNNTGCNGRFHFIGNVMGYTTTFGWGLGCLSADRAIYSYNVFLSPNGQKCPGTGNVATSVVPYVNGSDGASMDYHLSGPLGVADNLVPVSASNSGLATDRDGQARPAGSARDAGSDER